MFAFFLQAASYDYKYRRSSFSSKRLKMSDFVTKPHVEVVKVESQARKCVTSLDIVIYMPFAMQWLTLVTFI